MKDQFGPMHDQLIEMGLKMQEQMMVIKHDTTLTEEERHRKDYKRHREQYSKDTKYLERFQEL